MPGRVSHFRNADGIRGLACLIVLAAHSTFMFFPAVGAELAGVGKLGVWLFFVLSAFLLTNHLLMAPMTVSRLIDYGVGRVLRIIPLYWVAICVYWWLGTTSIATARDVVHAATLTVGFEHLWTIPVEMKFYVLLAALLPGLAWIQGRYGPRGSLVLLAVLAMLSVAISPPSSTPESTVALRWYVPCFLAGVAVAAIYPWIPKVGTVSISVVNVALIAVLVLATDHFRPMLGGPSQHGWLLNKFIPLGCAWAVLLALNIDAQGRWATIWNLAPLRFVGRWSYPIYLFHWLIVRKAASAYPGNLVVLVLALALVVAVSAGAHHFFERPVMALRPRLASLLTGALRRKRPAVGST